MTSFFYVEVCAKFDVSAGCMGLVVNPDFAIIIEM